MHIVIAAPTGYNTRELLLPLKEVLDAEPDEVTVTVVTPAADVRDTLFPSFDARYRFVTTMSEAADYAQLLRDVAADVVVTPTVGLEPLDVPLLQASKKRGVPTCVFVASWDNVYKMERLIARGYSGAHKGERAEYVIPDALAVWNDANREHVLRLWPQLKQEQVRAVGALRFDYFSHHDRVPSREALFDYLGWPHDGAALIHGATTELYPFDYIFRALARARDARRLQRATRFLATVHPGGNLSNHTALEQFGAQVRYAFGRRDPAPHPAFQFLPTEKEVYMAVALFMHTDVLVNQSSTVAIESMLADTPVVNVKYGKAFDPEAEGPADAIFDLLGAGYGVIARAMPKLVHAPFVNGLHWWRWRRSMVYRDFQQHYREIIDGGGTTIVERPRDLILAVNKYLEDPSHKQAERAATAKKMLTYTDGSASRRLLAFLKELAT